MAPDDDSDYDLTAAEEIRLLREDQREARKSAIIFLVVALVIAGAIYSQWDARREARTYAECIQRNVPIEEC